MRAALVVLVCFVSACGADFEVAAPVATSSVASASRPDDELVGSVEAPDGSAASEALVALNRPRGRTMALTRADAQGRFRLPRPREPFAITATSPQGTAVFVPPMDPVDSPRVPLRLRLGALSAGTVIAGKLQYVGNALPVGTPVSAARVSKDEGDVFHGEISTEGSFVLPLPAGAYVLRVDSDEVISQSVRVSGDPGARVDVVLAASHRGPAPDEVVAWLKKTAISISTTEVGTPDHDLAPLVAAFGDARVIGVGEATHGTLEFTRLKHRLLERLVATHGVTVLAMEANFGNAELVDEYLQTGRGTPETVVKNLFRVWQTEEVRELIAWMRKWNADPRHRRKIRFRGYDVQGARESIAAVRTYLRRVDPSGESLLSPLAVLDAPTNTRGMIELTDEQKNETSIAAARLLDHFSAKRTAYVARSSAAAYALVAQHARVIQQAQARFAAPTFREQFAVRDRAMGDNVAWLVEQAEPDARVLVWAHNGHVQLDASNLPAASMGSRLRELLGSKYLSVGFLLNEGAYRAAPDPKDPKKTVEVPLRAVSPGQAAEAFARVGIPIFAVDLRGRPGGIVSDWLVAPHLVQSYGWIVPEREHQGYPESLAHLFDVAIYIDRTSPSRPLQR
jgi:erythromycin esterase